MQQRLPGTRCISYMHVYSKNLGVHFHKISDSICEFLWNMRRLGLQLREWYGII